MALSAAAFALNLLPVYYLLVRSGTMQGCLQLLMRAGVALDRKWRRPEKDKELYRFTTQLLRDAQWADDRGWHLHLRAALTAVWFACTALACALSGWLAVAAVGALVAGDFAVLLAAVGPSSEGLQWGCDRFGVTCGMQPSKFRKHIVVTGGISIVAYTTGVLHAMFMRYGAAAFADCDFAGASSGSWTAMSGAMASAGAHPVDQFFELIFVGACKAAQCYPLRLIFVSTELIEEVATWAIRISEVHWKDAFEAVTREGRCAIWYFGYFLFSRADGQGLARKPWRLVLRGGKDFAGHGAGKAVAATSVFPYFTHYGLCGRLPTVPAVLDGYFPGRGVALLEVPDMVHACKGEPTLVFDMSGPMKNMYVNDKAVRVLSIQDWRNFTIADWACSSPSAYRELFATGVRDAGARWEEIDAAVFELFGIKPLPQN